MKVLIIGGVAAGTKTAAKLKRLDRNMEVTILTKDREISYAGCGLPYYVGGAVETKEQLIVNTPSKFEALTGVSVLTGREACALDPGKKEVQVRNLTDGSQETYGYDALVIATGASSLVPKMAGASLKGVFKLRVPGDAIDMRAWLQESKAGKAVVVGGGFIGLETAENLLAQGLQVTVLDAASQIMPNVLDPEMALYAKRHLQKNGIRVITGVQVEELLGDSQVTAVKTAAGTFPADLVVLSIGIRPNTDWLADSGLEMERGLILADRQLRTNLPDVYAAGDCVMVTNRQTGARQWSPMGSSANLEGRMLAQVLAGREKTYAGVLGTGIVRLPGLNCGRTGLTEQAAKDAGYDVETVLSVNDDKAHYYPGASFFATKLIADRKTRRLLGAQVFGTGAVDKMIDIAVAGISLGAVLEDFEQMDFSYAPPFSTAIHPFVQAVYVLENKLSGELVSITPAEYLAGAAEDFRIVDVAPTPQIPGAAFVKLEEVDGPVDGLDKEEKLLLVCAKGKRGYLLQNRLKQFGYTHTAVLEGATFFNEVKVQGVKATVSAADIKRVKGLGFLHDKNTPDRFNARVITRNGKITAEEMNAITEAARKFGSGEVTMTSRLTMEIQSVPYEKIDELREFLADAGLETGGTGSKVRPVVSCKGTTCQYGLIDTFAVSREIHERFYKGYHDVLLPHKFKIAVGGCPNNCVKPDLNDLGVVGQRIPELDLEKCRGCKKCQIVENCPIRIAKVEDGKLRIDPEICNHCGRCIGKCPFHAVENYTGGYRIYIGGRWGKKVAQGRYLDKVFTDKEEMMKVIEKAILLFREQGITGERFSDTIARLGFAYVQEQLLSDDLLKRKEENIRAEKHLTGGATC
jgi:NADPH-dependent 2,4-dienoyl-CoA reductase/sulfur reductase-like enzyme/dissimilatory sulfite reductase (desulfoviridin) alpha/beta subunit/rhodanese-related sulfurtransferase